MQVEIRFRRLQHLDPEMMQNLLDLRNELMVHHHRNPPEQRFVQHLTQRLTDESMLLLLALDGETAIGYALAFDVDAHPFMPEWGHTGYITQFCVAASYQRQGVGQQLFDAVMRWFSERNVPQVLLNVAPDNPAGRSFWQKQGFNPVAIRMKRDLDET